ncbi:MAG: GNAT family N-acetyltransferase [Gammaproteobacteria bacterium]|nr:GNAT family N-acetyltransferase [Gammaproteobacteria bacterium]
MNKLLELQAEATSKNMQHLIFESPIEEANKYLVKIAETPEELEEAFKLRFRVFNLEMNVGLDSAFENQMDMDEFDINSLLLIVVNKENGRIVATYRIQNYMIANSGKDFCGNNRFNLSQMPEEVLKSSLAVSRACMEPSHRNSKVFHLLWQGLAITLYENKLRYFWGCNSIPGASPQDANDYIALLEAMKVYHDTIMIEALPNSKCDYRKTPVDITNTSLPPMFDLYLRFKCRVCSDPAMYDDFKTLEFLIIYDATLISDRQHRMFMGDRKRFY